jgi:hypothetical protein
MNRSLRPALALAALLAAPATLPARQPSPGCIAGTGHSFAATGSVQTYALPAGATVVAIVADGASGGANIHLDQGGHGAHLAAQVAVAGLSTLTVVVGGAGGDGAAADGAGGGGGSFVYDQGHGLLLAAGAGGGAGGLPGNPGIDANLTTAGAKGGGVILAPGGTHGSGGDGGQGDAEFSGGSGGGGGGFLGPGHDGYSIFPGKGGHQISSPGDAAGGAAGAPGAGSGGYGGGGGAGPYSETWAGGGGAGGGYSGGGGGGLEASGAGGGGGSFVAAGGTTFAASILSSSGDGAVTICVAQLAPAAVPALTPWALALFAGAMVLAATVLLRAK